MALELSKNRTVNILVFSAIFGVIVSVLMLWYSTDKKAHINGGSLLASSEKHGVVFSMDKSFYRTDNDARVLNVASFKELGLQSPLADIAFSENALYVIEAAKHNVKKCDVALTGCQDVGLIPGSMSSLAMDIAITPDNKYYYISNSSLHRIDKFTIEGEHLYELEFGESLNYPNDIYAISNSVLAVADSVNERVIGVEDGNPKGRLDNSRIIWQLDVEKKVGKLGLDWPAALSFSDNGRLWVNNQNLYFDKGEIVIYDAIGFSFLEQTKRDSGEKVIVKYDSTVVPLNEGAEPRNFAAIKNFMIVGNFSPIELLKIDELTLGYGSFLDGILHNEFLELSDSREYWLGVETVSKYAIGLFILILIYGAYLETKEVKKREDENIEPLRDVDEIITSVPNRKFDANLLEPDENGIIWLNRKGVAMKNITYGMWGSVVLIPMLIGMMLLMPTSGKDKTEWYVIFVGMILLSGILAYFFRAVKNNVLLGRDEERIYLSNMFGQTTYAKFEDTYVVGNRIVIGMVSVMLKDGKGNGFYDEDECKMYIEPLKRLMKEMTETQYLMNNLKGGDVKTWLSVVVSIVTFIFLFFIWK